MPKHLSLDNFPRSKADDDKISKLCLATFNTTSGKEVLKYLRSITIEVVSGPNMSDAELRHLEGQRYLVGIIERRFIKGAKLKNE